MLKMDACKLWLEMLHGIQYPYYSIEVKMIEMLNYFYLRFLLAAPPTYIKHTNPNLTLRPILTRSTDYPFHLLTLHVYQNSCPFVNQL